MRRSMRVTQEKASDFVREVKKRSSLRVKKSKSVVISPSVKRNQDFVKLEDEEVKRKYVDEVNRNYEYQSRELSQTPVSTSMQVYSSPILHRSNSFPIPSPNSTLSTIYTPKTSTGTLDLTQSTPHVAGVVNPGHFRKLNSPLWDDDENKENEDPVLFTPRTEKNSLRRSFLTRSSTRRSKLFTPRPKKPVMTPSTPFRILGEKEPGDARMIPIKTGYLYKKSGSSKMYRRKYVTLCNNGSMQYYPSFQAYVDNVQSKEILLKYVTVKIPGRSKPQGLKLSTENRESSGDEVDKLENEGSTNRKPTKRMRKDDEEGSGAFELVIVSLDNRSWTFEVCSQEEGWEWVSSIEAEIQRSLSGNLDMSHRYSSQLEHIRKLVEGNKACVDCSRKDPGWASLNLGVVMCIECSGIHRNHGSHVSRVRSLELDSWPPAHIEVMTSLGNATANHVWEANMEKTRKPQPDDSRQKKEQFFKAKYIDKEFLEPIQEGNSISDHLVNAVIESDMRSLCLALAHSTSSDVNSDNNQQRKSPLHVAITQSNLAITQLLLWYKADVDEMDQENRTMIDIARQLSGGSSRDICDLLMSSHANSSSPSAKVFHESKLL